MLRRIKSVLLWCPIILLLFTFSAFPVYISISDQYNYSAYRSPIAYLWVFLLIVESVVVLLLARRDEKRKRGQAS